MKKISLNQFLSIIERKLLLGCSKDNRWTARIQDVNVLSKDENIMSFESGEGKDVNEAISAYVQNIRGRRLQLTTPGGTYNVKVPEELTN